MPFCMQSNVRLIANMKDLCAIFIAFLIKSVRLLFALMVGVSAELLSGSVQDAAIRTTPSIVLNFALVFIK